MNIRKRRFLSIFILLFILFSNLGILEARGEELNKETSRSETIPIRGGRVEMSNGSLRVDIDKGIYYKPGVLTLERLNRRPFRDRFISASDFYRIKMDEPLERYMDDKKIEISFEYYAGERGGIYMREDGSWTYLQSSIEDGRIKTHVNPRTIAKAGNVFTVLVDTRADDLYDIAGHWAKDEIRNYTRRGVIKGYPDKSFKPDRPISRAEFLILLSRAENWNLSADLSNNEHFKDKSSFNIYNEKEIAYSYENNYIVGYPDGYFRPYNQISYKEVDLIMRRVLGDPNFSWRTYAEKMIYDKRIRSSSYDNYNNNITRAEFSYMLYKLNEWKY